LSQCNSPAVEINLKPAIDLRGDELEMNL